MAEAQREHRRLPNKQKKQGGSAATVELLAQEEVPFLTQWERDAQEERRRYRMAQVNQVLNRAHGDLLAEEMSPTQAAHLKKRVQAVRDALTRAKGALGLAQTSSTVSEETVEEETTTSSGTIDVDAVAKEATMARHPDSDHAMESLLPTPSEIHLSEGALVSENTNGQIAMRKLPTLYQQQTQ